MHTHMLIIGLVGKPGHISSTIVKSETEEFVNCTKSFDTQLCFTKTSSSTNLANTYAG